MPYVPVSVDAYAGHRGAERPLAFILNGVRLEVADLLDRWYEGGLNPRDQKIDYFKIRTTDGKEYLLRYLSAFDSWSVKVPQPSETFPGSQV